MRTTISRAYADLNADLHRDSLAYGSSGGLYVKVALALAERYHTQSVLDYGSGKGCLAERLPFPIAQYDPAIPEASARPAPADIVICTDVLEHVEPDRLPSVLADLQRCVRKVGYFLIHTDASTKHLGDGRNTHLLQHEERWWHQTVAPFFTITKMNRKGPKISMLVEPSIS